MRSSGPPESRRMFFRSRSRKRLRVSSSRFEWILFTIAAIVINATMTSRSVRVTSRAVRENMLLPPPRRREGDVPGLVAVVVARIGALETDRDLPEQRRARVGGPRVRGDVVEVARIDDRELIARPVLQIGLLRVAGQGDPGLVAHALERREVGRRAEVEVGEGECVVGR